MKVMNPLIKHSASLALMVALASPVAMAQKNKPAAADKKTTITASASKTPAGKYYEGSVVFSMETENAEIAPMLPTGMEMHYQGPNSRVKVLGGPQPTDMLTLGEEVYIIKKGTKEALKMKEVKPYTDKKDGDSLKVTRTTETKDILGYKCTKVTMQSEMGGMPATVVAWVNKDLMPAKPKVEAQSGLFNARDMGGFPLEYTLDIGMAQITLKATKITPGTVDASLLAIPAGYTKRDFDAAKDIKMPGAGGSRE
jgi:hypothetical protein